MHDLGLEVKILRENRGWSQAELAKRAGVTKSSISMYEQGVRVPSAVVLYSFAKAFGVSADHLLGLSDARSVSLDGLSEQNEALVRELVEALREK